VAGDIEPKVRKICLALPDATEKMSHGAPAFFAGKKQFAMLWPDGHHDHTFPHMWCAAEAGAQEALVASSERFFRPPYVGHRGWIGVRLDGPVDWDEVAELLQDAHRVVATARRAR
jgi:predicted DNA-binding protein (MmcQ/YjbR family)